MHVYLAAVGRLKKGPERELATRFTDRVTKHGKIVGISSFKIVEIAESRAPGNVARKREEAQNLLSRIPQDARLFVFDEKGDSPQSRQFAGAIGEQLDGGIQSLALIVGGPDGLDQLVRDRASRIISFGALTLPHQLVRVLVLEQVYRAITILTNHPYHRD